MNENLPSRWRKGELPGAPELSMEKVIPEPTGCGVAGRASPLRNPPVFSRAAHSRPRPAGGPAVSPQTARDRGRDRMMAPLRPLPLRFRTLSYNCLADELAYAHAAELYRAVPRDLLSWPGRLAGLVAEIAHWRPSICLLQEVDRADDVR